MEVECILVMWFGDGGEMGSGFSLRDLNYVLWEVERLILKCGGGLMYWMQGSYIDPCRSIKTLFNWYQF